MHTHNLDAPSTAGRSGRWRPPEPLKSLAFGFIWTLILLRGVLTPLQIKGHRTVEDLGLIAAICTTSALLAVLGTRYAGSRWLAHHPPASRFAATLIALSLATIGLMAGLFGLHFRLYFAQWHEPFLSPAWFFQFAFTVAYSVYLFAANILHQLVTPLNLILLIACSWWFKPGHRQASRGLGGGLSQ